MTMKSHFFSIVTLAVLAGCGSSGGSEAHPPNGNDNNHNDAVPDAGPVETPDAAPPPPPVDHGAPSDTYPAFKADVPQLRNNGGPILKNPKIVTVTWPDDTLAADLEKFGDA